MATSETLQDVVAALLGTKPADVHPELAFAGTRLQGSLARARLYTTIERQLGVTCQAVYTARTYGELHAAIHRAAKVGAAPPAPAPASPPALGQRAPHNGATPSVACGIDIEMVASLPAVADYWTDAFYSATFTPTEIAYCLLQEQPLNHFAVRWCAKEALKKCDSTYLQADLGTLEVALSVSGAPYLCAVANGQSTPLPFAVSLSHTPQVAVAVVVKVPANSPAESTVTPAVSPAVTAPPATSAYAGSRWPGAWLPLLMGGSALALALWALVRTW